MTNHATSPWSDSLRQQTRDAIEEMPITPDGRLHFKHATRGYAFAALEDLFNSRLLLRSKTGGGDWLFEDVEALLEAGWAVD
ncbi:hypothetical protein [Polaromonas naphthalenivorans]|uniref:Uncharacterized protein n=1 Tax=Polaromonas naphthalenivorans (strain CJ2) TaxID=365044 RepID=A1VM35_POLNA|nr:hypothetical protein [Polaromonas naphthalenivorans]ABM36713.1 hypothetical protein Pnap_1399 [Polaromonas naphthalenivorans CJ2]